MTALHAVIRLCKENMLDEYSDKYEGYQLS